MQNSLTLKQCTFESITQPENNLSASINSCRDFLIRSFYIQNYIFVLILWTRFALRADGCVSLATLSKIKSGEKAQEKNSSGILWCYSIQGSPLELRADIGSYRFLRWCRKCCCLSIFRCEFGIFCIGFSKGMYILVSQKFWIETHTEIIHGVST